MSGWVAGAVVGSAVIGAVASNKAAKTQANAAKSASDLQYQQWKESVELQEPWRKAGQTALEKLTPLATEYTPFGMEQFQADPGYAFRMAEGTKALERSAAAKGLLMSGGTLKGTQRYGQDLASQEYMNAFNRYQTERQARLAPLQSLAGVGQSTVQQLGQSGQTMASNVGDLMTSGAAARASGYVGSANALTQGLGQYLNYSQRMNALGTTPTVPSSPSYSLYDMGMGTGFTG